MNRKFILILFVTFLSFTKDVNAQANTTLSNLTSPTAINESLLPSFSYLTLGNPTKRWRFIYFDSAIWIKNQRSIYARGTGNFFTGVNAGNFTFTGTDNSAFGQMALSNFTLGYRNTAIGSGSLSSLNIGGDNVAVGYGVMFASTGGNFNTAVGNYSLYNSSGERNTAIGFRSMNNNSTGSYNDATGTFALYDNTTGSYNTASGYSSLHDNHAGNYNTAMGYYALTIASNTSYNTAIGYNCMVNASTGNYNTASGAEALYFNRGVNNTATGFQALRGNFEGINSTAVGYHSLRVNSSGSGNTAIGSLSLQQNSSGNYNAAIGRFSLSGNTTGSYNTALGYNANVSAGTYINATAIGSSTTATASNQVRIGSASVTSIGGYANWTNISDGRVKKNIRENVAGLSFINRLKAVTYNLDITAIDKKLKAVDNDNEDPQSENAKSRAAKEKIIYTGFVAQDVEEAAQEANYSFSGVDAPKNENDMYGLRYAEFVVPLVKAVQELSAQNTSLKEENLQLKKRIENIEARLKMNTAAGLEEGLLEQNSPNPARGITKIPYSLPTNANNAILVVSDAVGKIVKSFSLNGGRGIIQLDTNRLSAGAYHYTLYAGNRILDAKQLVIVK